MHTRFSVFHALAYQSLSGRYRHYLHFPDADTEKGGNLPQVTQQADAGARNEWVEPGLYSWDSAVTGEE